jgi:hypothetical protein
MISVFKFASGSCDSTNVFGHAAIVFSGLGPDSFAISQMKGDGSNPTWHNSEELIQGIKNQSYATRTDQWESRFFSSRENHAFPMVVKKAYIISNEDLEHRNYNCPPNWTGLSERRAFIWWKSVLQTEWNMPRALNGADCTDTVIRAI